MYKKQVQASKEKIYAYLYMLPKGLLRKGLFSIGDRRNAYGRTQVSPLLKG